MSKAFCMAFRFGLVGALLISASLFGCHAHEVPSGWSSDCVGRMTVAFPGEIDVAAATLADIQKYSDPPSSSFVDHQPAPWSDLGYLGGVRVIHGLDAAKLNDLIQRWADGRDKFRNVAGAKKSAAPYKDLSVAPLEGFAFQAQGLRYLTIKFGEHIFTWDGFSGVSEKQAQEEFDTVIRGIQPRSLHSVPEMQGVCLPYAFIRDDGARRRYIAMTYRLREHPDVTIMLKDRNAVEIDSKANPAVYDPESISDSFWSRYDNTYRKSLRSVWSSPYKHIKLANSKGLESFVKIVRKDDAVDYGYLVVTKGDPAAKEDTPDLMLYVIQDSKNAKAKGIAPMEKEAFLSMAQTIAASVKRRPTSP